MANKKGDTRKTKIHDIEVDQVYFADWYTTVASRVKLAQQVPPAEIRKPSGGFHVVSHSIIPVADRWAFTCIVEYPVGSGVHTSGSDFIDVKDATGLAKAETSAIGRALSFHGIDIEGGIASAEEMERVVPAEAASPSPGSTLERYREFQQIVESTNPMVEHIPVEPTEDDWKSLKVRIFKSKLATNPTQFEALMEQTGGDYADVLAKVEAIEQHDLRALNTAKSRKGVH